MAIRGQTEAAPNPKRWIILLAVMSAGIMGPIDGTVVNIALPTISTVFNASVAVVGWVPMAYLLILGSLILTYGRLGDMFGFRRVFLTGVVIFTVASAISASAPNIWILILFRAFQALGAGMFMAMGQAIVTSVFPTKERGRALGTNSMVVAVGLALGPSLGGFLLTVSSWRAIFWINIPIGIFAFFFARSVLPLPKDLKRQKFDARGAILGFVSLASLLLAGSYGGEYGWRSPLVYILTVLFFVGTWGFVSWERRVDQPMLDLTLFRNKVFAGANFAALMNFIAQSAAVFLVPFYLETVLRFTPQHTGLILTASPAVTFVVAPLSGALSDRLGTRRLAFIGQSIVTVAFLLLHTLNASSTGLDIAWRLAIFGLGVGMFQSPNNSAIMGNVPRNRLGVGSGVLATVRNVGMVLGVAVSSTVFAMQQSLISGRAGADATTAFMAGLRAAYLVAAILAAAGAFTSLIRSDKAPALTSVPERPAQG